jgi:hypothetical protein
VRSVQDRVVKLDRQNRQLQLISGRHLGYDFLLLHVERDKPVPPATIPQQRRIEEARNIFIPFVKPY